MSRNPSPATILVTHPGAELYGSDRMLLESVRALAGAGADVVVALPVHGPLVAHLVDAGARVEVLTFPVLRKSATTPRGALALVATAAASLRASWRLLRRVRPGVVCVSTLTTPTWPLLARASGARAVVHVHEAEPGAPRLVQRVMAAPLLAASGVVVNSAFARDVLVAAQPRLRERTRVVLNGVAGPPQPPVPGADLEGAGTARRLRLLYVGRLSRRKGVLVALEALELLVARGVDAELHLVGDVFGEHVGFDAELSVAAARPAASGRVHRHGFGDVWPHLARADVVVVPSLLPEPFGNTAVEAVLAARPVVASSCGGLPEAVEVARSARLVPPGDAAAVADAVAAIAADLPAAHAQAQRDSEAAAQRFAAARYGAQVVDAVLGGRR